MRFLPCLIAGILLAGPAAAAAPTATPDPSAPAAEVVRTEFDFGTVSAGARIPYTFRIRNTGRRPLAILRVEPECDCTLAGAWERRVPPGAEGAVPLVLETRDLRGESRRVIRVVTDDPLHPELRLEFRGRVLAPLEVQPRPLRFGRLYPETRPWKRTLHLQPPADRPFLLDAALCDNPVFRLTLSPRGLRGGQELSVALPDGLAPGIYAGMIELSYRDDGRRGQLRVPVSASVPWPVDVQPRRLRLPARVLARPYRRTLVLRAAGEGRLELGEAALTVPGAKLVLRPAVPGRIVFADLELPAGWALPASGAELRFRVLAPEAQILPVPLETEDAPAGPEAAR